MDDRAGISVDPIADCTARLREADLLRHVGQLVAESDDDGVTVIVEVRRELIGHLAPEIQTALSGIRFELQEKIFEGELWGSPSVADASDDVVVRPSTDDRPETARIVEGRLREHGLHGALGSMAIEVRDGRDFVRLWLSARAPVGVEKQVSAALDGVPHEIAGRKTRLRGRAQG